MPTRMALCVARFLPIVGLLAGCTDTSPHTVGKATEEIVDGTRELGMPSVVLVVSSIASCTGTIISKRVVLTAKHCVGSEEMGVFPAETMRVYVGSSTETVTHGYAVTEARIVPGRWDATDATDVALLILAAEARETPLAVSFDNPLQLNGKEMTAVGFGVTPTGRVGVKYRTEQPILAIEGGRIDSEPSVCPGDSGGPLLGPDGRVWGVASFMFTFDENPPVCGEAPAAFNTIHLYRDLLIDAVESTHGCLSTGDEVCGTEADEDCDGEVDEDCNVIETSDACMDDVDGGCPSDEPDAETATTRELQDKENVEGGMCDVRFGGRPENTTWMIALLLLAFARRRRYRTNESTASRPFSG